MLAILLGLFRLIWLCGRGHHAVVLENLALRQQLAIYKRKKKFVAHATHSRRVAEARNRGFGTDRFQSLADRETAAVTDLEDFLREPHWGDRRHSTSSLYRLSACGFCLCFSCWNISGGRYFISESRTT